MVRRGRRLRARADDPSPNAEPTGSLPRGLLASMLEKYQEWSDCEGDVSRCFPDVSLLVHKTRSRRHFSSTTSTPTGGPPGSGGSMSRLPSPSSPRTSLWGPGTWAERSYNVTRYTTMPGGGHFAAYEQPDPLSRDLVAFFRTAQRLPVIMQTEDANSERIASMGSARSIVEGLPDLWGAAAEYSLKLQRDVIATSTAPRGLPAMHHLARLHAELTVGTPSPSSWRTSYSIGR